MKSSARIDKRRNAETPLTEQKSDCKTRITIITTLLASIFLALYLGPGIENEFLAAHSATLGSLVFERPIEIVLPDGIPAINEMRDFMRNITKRADYREPLDLYEESDVSRSEAASIAFELARAREVPAIVLCDKYYKLFESDKHLTLGGVEELIGDARAFDEIEQPDANLAAHLAAESNYDSLKRLVTLHNVLLDEGIGVVSTIDLKVQKNILQCMKYYKERHERALDGLSDYLWTKRDEIPKYKGNLDKLMDQFNYFMDIIANIEMEIDTLLSDESDQLKRIKLTNEWLNRMAKMHRTLELASPIIPNSVRKFIANERRREDFQRILSLMEQFERHKRRVLQLEQEKDRLSDYREALLSLYEFAKPHEQWLQEEFSFITEPRRDSFILGHIFRLEHEDVELPIPKQLINPNVEQAVRNRMIQQAEENELNVEKNEQNDIDLSKLPDLHEVDVEKVRNLLPIQVPTSADQEPVGMLSTGWAERPYSLEQNSQFAEERSLDEYGISFYVKPDFEDKYEGDELVNILSDVIREILADLESKCKIEKARQIARVSCEKYAKIQQTIESN